MTVHRIGTKAQHESELELDMKVSRIGAGAQHEVELGLELELNKKVSSTIARTQCEDELHWN